jgi:coenzyme F420-reducing hydrogenase gamma subunit
MTEKPKVAIFDFACCEGCQLQIVNMEEELLDLLGAVSPVEWREAMSETSDSYDIAIIEGSITRPEDAERLKKIRAKAKILIALGACATLGGVNRLKNSMPNGKAAAYVYGKAASQNHLKSEKTQAVHEVVKVDFKIHGCPIDNREFAAIIRSLLAGKTPFVPTYPVCVECKQKGNICRYEYKEVCLGPVIRAGCGARCPSNGFWCFGCRGYVDDPNVNAAYDVMNLYGKTMDDFKGRLDLFAGLETESNAKKS